MDVSSETPGLDVLVPLARNVKQVDRYVHVQLQPIASTAHGIVSAPSLTVRVATVQSALAVTLSKSGPQHADHRLHGSSRSRIVLGSGRRCSGFPLPEIPGSHVARLPLAELALVGVGLVACLTA